jgi:hypothetical protein
MIRSSTSLRRQLAAVLGAAALFLLPSTAAAQTADPGAPSPGTPTSNQYEIPVQAGRHDAAPPRAQRNSGGNGSLYRSDNNFGSSSVVPGDSGGGGGGPAGGAAAGGVTAGAAAAAAAGGAGDSGSGGGGETLDTGSPSASAAYTTLPLIILLGVVIGIAGVRMRRQSEV